MSTLRREAEASIASLSWAAEIAVEQRLAAGVAHGQVQPALVVLQPVAEEVEQGEVVPAAPGVEVGDRLADHVVRLVDQHRDVEAGDVRVLEDGGERFGVVLRGGEPAQAGVPVVVGGDDEAPCGPDTAQTGW